MATIQIDTFENNQFEDEIVEEMSEADREAQRILAEMDAS